MPLGAFLGFNHCREIVIFGWGVFIQWKKWWNSEIYNDFISNCPSAFIQVISVTHVMVRINFMDFNLTISYQLLSLVIITWGGI